jgi:DNA invertase Pin-like site-specific DNA recombinase
MAEKKQTVPRTKNIYGYIRVSTINQDHDLQKNKIMEFAEYRKLNILRIFEDKASGKNVKRKGFQELYDALQTDHQGIDAVVITKLDRLGRSLKDLLNITHWLDEHDIGLIIIESNIDTTTSEGRLFFHFMASIAEYERERILERTEEGRQAAKENGTTFGRRKKDLSMRDIERMIFAGVPISEIARKLKVSRATIYRRIEERKEAEHNTTTKGADLEVELKEEI